MDKTKIENAINSIRQIKSEIELLNNDIKDIKKNLCKDQNIDPAAFGQFLRLILKPSDEIKEEQEQLDKLLILFEIV